MASAALPPVPGVEIEGEHYWDGGLVSNTPLQWIADCHPHLDTLAFQVDLWNACGRSCPAHDRRGATKKKSSTPEYPRRDESFQKYVQRMRRGMADLFDEAPRGLRTAPDAIVLRPVGDRKVYNLCTSSTRQELRKAIRRTTTSAHSMRDHWTPAITTHSHLAPSGSFSSARRITKGVFTFDLDCDGRG